mmetsp:Transcript_24430/g.61387  ORF Transcript_24430/g.61387 Transcript_24430/m.61387 type:complete len:527 (-) Transcript_24430:502-2082(-)
MPIRRATRESLHRRCQPRIGGIRWHRAASATEYIRVGLREVAHPAVRLVLAVVFQNLQVAHLQPRGVVHRDDEGQRHGPKVLADAGVGLLREGDAHLQHALRAAHQVFHVPEHRLVLLLELRRLRLAALGGRVEVEVDLAGVLRHGDLHLERRGFLVRGELCLEPDEDLHLVWVHLVHSGDQAERRPEVAGAAEVHDGKLTVRRRDLQCPVDIKAAEVAGADEVAIVQRDDVAGVGPVALQLRLTLADEQVVAERDLHGRVVPQVVLDLDGAQDLVCVHGTIGGEGYINLLDDVHKDLLARRALRLAAIQHAAHHARVAHARPEEGACALARRHHDAGLVEHKCLERLGGGILREPVVDRLVQQFIDNDEVLADGVLAEHACVVLDDVAHAAEQLQHHRGRHVVARRRHQQHAPALHVQVRHPIDVEHRRGLAALVAVPKLHLSEECLGTRLGHVAEEVSRDDGVSPRGEDEKLGDHGGREQQSPYTALPVLCRRSSGCMPLCGGPTPRLVEQTPRLYRLAPRDSV